MNKYTSFFEDIVKTLASFSIILLIAGYVDIKTYYNYFGINISPYISSSEILMTSLDNLIMVFSSVLFQMIIWLFLFEYLFDYTDEENDKYWEGKRRPKDNSSDDLTMVRFLNSKKIKIFVLALIVASGISIALKYIFPSNTIVLQLILTLSLNFWVFMCLYLLWLPITRIILRIAKKQSHYNPKLIVSFVIFLPILLLTIWVKNSMFVGNRIRKYGNMNKIEIRLQTDSIISSNDSIRFLGRTEDYIFFWNKNTWISTIYPAGQIKQITNYKKE